MTQESQVELETGSSESSLLALAGVIYAYTVNFFQWYDTLYRHLDPLMGPPSSVLEATRNATTAFS